jgi:hypothetical protein
MTITSPGIYNLINDIGGYGIGTGTPTSNCITINSDNVIFDGHNNKIIGLDSPVPTNAIFVNGSSNIIIKNIYIDSFHNSDIYLKNTYSVDIDNSTLSALSSDSGLIIETSSYVDVTNTAFSGQAFSGDAWGITFINSSFININDSSFATQMESATI